VVAHSALEPLERTGATITRGVVSMKTLNDVAPRSVPCTRTLSSTPEKHGRNVVTDELPRHTLPREEK